MPTHVIMPQLGETVVEGTISRWLVNEGDTVDQFDIIMEVSTDKVDTEIPAPISGTVLRIYFPEGETLLAGTVLAVIGQPGEAVPDQPEVLEVHGPVADRLAEPEPASPEPRPELGRISPVVARIAQEHGVDLSRVAGTGRDGRITKKDILAHVEATAPGPRADATPELPAWEQPGTGDLFKPTDDLPLAAAPVPIPAKASSSADAAQVLVPHSRLRRLIAEHMVASKRTSPHVTTVMEADLSAVVAHRAAHKDQLAAQGVNLTFTPYFIQATIAALQAVPEVNAVYQPEGLLLQRRYHIGMATAVPDGLMVPVIHDADHYSLLGLARQVNDLAQRARAGQLKPDEIQGSTFTITNHGTAGSLFAAPIINQPNVGILGIGAIQKRAVVLSAGHSIEPSAQDAIAIRPMAYLSLTFDHRVLDGVGADRFLATVKQALERWPTP